MVFDQGLQSRQSRVHLIIIVSVVTNTAYCTCFVVFKDTAPMNAEYAIAIAPYKNRKLELRGRFFCLNLMCDVFFNHSESEFIKININNSFVLLCDAANGCGAAKPVKLVK